MNKNTKSQGIIICSERLLVYRSVQLWNFVHCIPPSSIFAYLPYLCTLKIFYHNVRSGVVFSLNTRVLHKTGSILDVNDHVPWQPLDQNAESPTHDTKIQNMLIAEDSELKAIDTRNGTVHFRQVGNSQIVQPCAFRTSVSHCVANG